MTIMVFLVSFIAFGYFIFVSSYLLNGAVKQSQKYRRHPYFWNKVKYNFFTTAYSAIFTIMLIASVCFPLCMAGLDLPQKIQFKTIQTVIEERMEYYQLVIQKEAEFNIFNELNTIVKRFQNEDIESYIRE